MSFAPEATEILNKIRSDKGEVHWMAIRLSDDGKTIDLVGSGNEDWDTFINCLAQQEAGLFGGIFKVRAVDNRGSVKSIRTKIIRVTVLSAGLPMMKRARASGQKPEFEKFFGTTHLNLDTDDITHSSLSKLEVARSLLRFGGAHTPNSFEFSGGQEATDADTIKIEGGACMPPQTSGTASPKTPASPVEEKKEEKKEEAAAAAAAEEKKPASPTTTSAEINPANNKATGSSKMSPEDAWQKVIGDADPINWVLLSYDGKNASTAELYASGSQGLDEFKANLDDEKVLFGGLRVTAVDDRGSVKSVRSKFVFVQYMGNNVKPLVRASAGTARGEFQKILAGTHVNVNIDSGNDQAMSPKALEERLHSSCGAHKPNGYDFGTKKRKPEDLE